MGYTALSPDILSWILSIPGIVILVALLLPLVCLIYLPFCSAPHVPPDSLKSKLKSDMASVIVPKEPKPTKVFGLPKEADLLDEALVFDHPTLLPYSTRAPEPIVREVLSRSCSQIAHGHNISRDRGNRRALQVSKLIRRQGSPIYLGSDSTRDDIPELIPGLSEKILTPEEIRLQLANPHGWIKWAIHGSTVFDNQHDEAVAAGCIGSVFGPKGVKNNMFFQWGLRYVPTHEVDNVYRAVVLENLPQNVTLDQILPRIHGGQIYSAFLGNLKTSPTAMVTFVHQDGALAFLSRVAQEGLYVGLTSVRVRPVPTPTYILSGDMETEILQNGRSRCLIFSSRNPATKQKLYDRLVRSHFSSHVECFGKHSDKEDITVRFDSIKTAIQAYNALGNSEMFKQVKFGIDPCSEV